MNTLIQSGVIRALLSAAWLGLAALYSGASAAQDFASANARLVDDVVLPAYRALASEAAALERSTTALCERPSDAGLDAAKAQFDATMNAWQRAQPLAFGPIKWESRGMRIQFWPDKRGTARRQLAGALGKRDAGLLAPDGLQGRSAAVQSLAAYEVLVYEQPVARAEGDYACALAAAIARFQSSLAASLLYDWDGDTGYGADVKSAEYGNYKYNSARAASADFYRTMVGTLDVVARNKLERPLGLAAGDALAAADPRPKRLESWRSGHSSANIGANLNTVAAMYEGLSPLLVEKNPALDAVVMNKMDALKAQAAALPVVLRDALAEDAGIQQVAALLASVREMRALLAGPVGKTVGLDVGFNASDGD